MKVDKYAPAGDGLIIESQVYLNNNQKKMLFDLLHKQKDGFKGKKENWLEKKSSFGIETRCYL